jgi:hypothetical protein
MEQSKFLSSLLLLVPCLERVVETSWQCSLSRLVKRPSNCFPSPPQEIYNKGPISIAHCIISDSSTCWTPNSLSHWTPCWSRTTKSVRGNCPSHIAQSRIPLRVEPRTPSHAEPHTDQVPPNLSKETVQPNETWGQTRPITSRVG